MTSFLENLTHTETIDTATTTSSPSRTTVRRVSESYPIRMRSLFQTPHQGQKDFFNLPAGVEQSLQRSTTVSVNGTQTFSSWLDDTVNASGLLSRTNGVTTLSGGRDSEDYVASDSTGYCYHHKLVAAQGGSQATSFCAPAEATLPHRTADNRRPGDAGSISRRAACATKSAARR